MQHFAVDLIEQARLVAIIRLDDLAHGVELADALYQGGVVAQEFTLTNRDALHAIAAVRRELPQFSSDAATVGVGSVRNVDDARAAIQAGAQFVVTPTLNQSVIEYCIAEEIPVMSGAYTPTEIARAWELGSSIVKVFPARNLGANYIKDVLAPMPELKLMPTGGVGLSNMVGFFDAGACSVGVGGSLVDHVAVQHRCWSDITTVAAEYSKAAARSDTF